MARPAKPQSQPIPVQPPPPPSPEPSASVSKVLAPESLEEISRPVHSDVFGRKGINKVRVLSESMLESLVLRLVEGRVESRIASLHAVETLSETEPAAAKAEELRQWLAAELETRCDGLRREREERSRRLEERARVLESSLAELERTIARLEATARAEAAALAPTPGAAEDVEFSLSDLLDLAPEPTEETPIVFLEQLEASPGAAAAPPSQGEGAKVAASTVAENPRVVPCELTSRRLALAPAAGGGPQLGGAAPQRLGGAIHVVGCRPAAEGKADRR